MLTGTPPQNTIYNIDFSNGFNGNALTLNGTAAYKGSQLQLLNGTSANQSASAFYTIPNPLGQLQTDFSFQAGKSASGGLAFVLQGSSPSALGSSGADGWQGLPGNNVVLDFSLASSSASLVVNGSQVGSTSVGPSGLSFASGDVIDVDIQSNGTLLTVKETDETTQVSTTQKYQSINLANLMGNSQGYMGFTAGSGSSAQTVNVLRWSYEPLNTPAPVGINLGTPGTDSINLFANLAQVGTWRGVNGQPLTVDANGWPTSDATLVIGAGRPFPPGTYTLSFQGQSQQFYVYGGGVGLISTSASSYNPATNTTTLTFNTPTPLSSLAVAFIGTQRDPGDSSSNGGTGITNVQLMLPLYPGATSSYSPGTLFTTQAINYLSQFNTIRYMDYSATNWNPQASWSERVLPGYATQVVTGPLAGWQGLGMSWEDAVALANATQTSLYVTIPANASDDYVTRLAELIKYGSDGVNPYTQPVANPVYAPLNPNLRVYIEYSNEVWNSGFQQYQDVNTIAQASAGQPGSPLSVAGAGNLPAERAYALRIIQISGLFRQVFGDSQMSSRIRPLAEWQSGGGWYGQEDMLSFINNYFNNGNGQQNVANPHPVNYYLWGGGGGWYTAFNNTSGAGEVSLASSNLLTFSGTAGAAGVNGSPSGPVPSSGGTSPTYIQGTGSISQTFTTTYNGPADLQLSLASSPGASEAVNVYLDGHLLPWSQMTTSWSTTQTQFVPVDSNGAFALTPGTHTLQLVGTGGSGTLFVGNMVVGAVDPLVLSGATPAASVASDVQLANAYGLQDVGYEGHLVANASTTIPNSDLFGAAAMDPRTQQLEANAITSFFQAGGAMPIVYNAVGNPYFADASPTIYNTNTPRVLAAQAVMAGPQPTAPVGQAVATSTVTIIDPGSQGQALSLGPATNEVDSFLLQAAQQESFNLAMTVGQGGVAPGTANVYFNGALVGTYTIPNTPGTVSLGQVFLHPGENSLRIQTVHGVNDPSQPGNARYYLWQPTSLTLIPAGAPSAPAILVVKAGNGVLNLTWSTVAGAGSYNLYRSTSPAPNTGQLTLYQSGLHTNGFADNSASLGKSYYYYVTAVNAISEGAPSASVTGTLLPAPAGFTVTAGYPQVSLSWQSVAAATSYYIYRGTSYGGETLLATVGQYATGYVDNPPSLNQRYYYYLRAGNANGLGPGTVQFSATVVQPASAPAAPAGLKVTPQNGGAYLSWTPTPGATNYKIYRGTSSGGETYLTTTWWSGAGMYDSNLSNNTHYYYYITAVNPRGEGAPSAETGVVPSLPPSAPTNLAALVGSGQLALSWTGVSGATSYNVLRGVGNGPVTLYATGITGTSFTDSSVSNGVSYHYYVVAFTPVGGSGWSAGVTATPTPPPATPTGLLAVPANGFVQLSWQLSPTATSYSLYRGTQSGSEALLASGLTGPFYTDSSVSNGTTYYYRIQASSTTTSSGLSGEVSTTPALLSPPAAPTGLTATPGDGQVTLSWTASPGATSYNIYRSTSSGQEQLIDPGVTGTTYIDSGYDVPTSANYSLALSTSSFLFTVDGTTYYYEVKAVNTAGEGNASSEATATPVPIPPPSPTGLTALAGDNQVALSWSPASEAVTYNIYRGSSSGQLTLLQAGISGLSYTDTTAQDGTTYFYSVTGVNSSGEGARATAATVTLALPTAPPLAPGNVQATPGDGSATLTWTAVPGAASYSIFRGTQNGGETLLTSGLGGTSYYDAGLSYGMTYYYQVEAVNAAGASIPSTQVTAVLPALNQAPVAPLSLTATPASGMVTLTWAPVANATSYNIYRGTSAGSETYYANTAQAQLLDTKVGNGATYYYFVQAVNLSGPSSASTQVSATPQLAYSLAAPSAPTGLTIQASNSSATLTWQPTPGATEYLVYRGTSQGGERILSSIVRDTTFTDGGLTNGTLYYYYVIAVSTPASGSPHLSAPSQEVQATPLAIPTGLSGVDGPQAGQVQLSWAPVPGAASYAVYRGTVSGGEVLDMSGLTSPSFLDTGLIPGKTYYYTVTALAAGGASPVSTELVITA